MLTVDDIALLLEAVDEWEKKESSDLIMGTMLSLMFCKNEHAARDVLAESELESKRLNESKQARKERAILLKATLIQLRDKLEVDDFVNMLEE